MDLHLHYDPEVDIAMLSFEDGRAISQEHSWGLIDRHPDDGHLMGFEIWEASTILPAELIAALLAERGMRAEGECLPVSVAGEPTVTAA